MTADNFFNRKFDSYDYFNFNRDFSAKDVTDMLKEFGKIQVEEFRQELLKQIIQAHGMVDVKDIMKVIQQTEIKF